MVRASKIKSRSVILALLVLTVFSFLLLASRRSEQQHRQSSGSTHIGHAIAPKLGNATVKAELGRAAWKVLHTTFARFPEKPSQEESETLRSFVHLFQRVYPCGECATHFGQLLAKYPPQVSSRTAAAMWGCFVHNLVNKRLAKAEFDCKNIGEAYDCGCGEEAETTPRR